jgi:hypothetical protein
LVRGFPAAQRVPDSLVSTQTFPGQFVATTSFIEHVEGEPRRWEVRVWLSRHQLIVWSFVDDGQRDYEHSQALVMAAGLRLAAPPMGRSTRWSDAITALKRRTKL